MRPRVPVIIIIALSSTSTPFAAIAENPPLAPVPAFAAARLANVQVRVAPDHADWTYRVGEKALFRVSVTADNEAVRGATIHYTIGPEDFPGSMQTAVVPAQGLVIDGGTMGAPGFLRCIATFDIEKRTYTGLATAGYDPENIQPTQAEPADFDEFWKAGMAALAKVPIDPKFTLLPDQCTAKVDVYDVSVQNIGVAGPTLFTRIYGILSVPKGPGLFPAVLRLPGAGVRPPAEEFIEREIAERGVITLAISIHGIPLNLPNEIYDQLNIGALWYYPTYNLDDRDSYYYRRAFLGCIRADDFLSTLPKFDGRNLLVCGASQGGLLSIVTAALDSRVKALVCLMPAYCDVTGYLHGRAGGWPKIFRPGVDGQPNPQDTVEKIRVTGYYDAVNFARRLKVPGHYLWGYNDQSCAPTSMFAAYNVISAPKQLTLNLEVGHISTSEQEEQTARWILAALGIKSN